jgi:hypothetical protein
VRGVPVRDGAIDRPPLLRRSAALYLLTPKPIRWRPRQDWNLRLRGKTVPAGSGELLVQS